MLNTNSNFDQLEDQALFILYQTEQDMKAFTTLWERYRHLLYGQALYYLKDPDAAKDAVQHAATQLLTTKKTIDTPKNWLFIIVRNFCLKISKYSDNKEVIDEENDIFLQNENFIIENDPLKTLIEEQTNSELLAALQSLSEEQRVCLELFYWEKFSMKQIAKKTAYEVNKVRSYLQNGRLNLRKKLDHLNS